MTTDLPTLAINTIRTLAIDAVQKANSGHPGCRWAARRWRTCCGNATSSTIRDAPHWFDRDRFVLSAGHGSMLLYCAAPPHRLRRCRSTSSSSSASGAARRRAIPSGRRMHARASRRRPGRSARARRTRSAWRSPSATSRTYFNRPGHTIIDHHTYALVSDGDVMEGVACEAASHRRPPRARQADRISTTRTTITLDGPLSLVDERGRRRALRGVRLARAARRERRYRSRRDRRARSPRRKAETERPSIIIIRTTIGYGSPKKAGTCVGARLAARRCRGRGDQAGARLGSEREVPRSRRRARRTSAEAARRGAAAQRVAREAARRTRRRIPSSPRSSSSRSTGELPAGWDAGPADVQRAAIATRIGVGQGDGGARREDPVAVRRRRRPRRLDQDDRARAATYDAAGEGRNLRFGIREHAMGSIGNGMLYHGGVRPFVATFFVFSDYMRPAVRLAALNKHAGDLRVDARLDRPRRGRPDPPAGRAPDGAARDAEPRGVPSVRRQRDRRRLAARAARARRARPALVLSRQDLPTVTQPGAPGAERGAYVLADGDATSILIATGSEVAVALAARDELAKHERRRRASSRCRAGSCSRSRTPRIASRCCRARSWQRVSVEAGVTMGWRE